MEQVTERRSCTVGMRMVPSCLKPLAAAWAAHAQSRLCEAWNREAAAGLRDRHRDGGHADLRALGFLEKRIEKASLSTQQSVP